MRGVVFDVAGESFRCKPEVSRWSAMKLIKAYGAGGNIMLAAQFDFILNVVEEDELERLDAFLTAATGLETADFTDAINEVLAQYAERPKSTPLPASDGSRVTSISQGAASPSQGGGPAGAATS